MAYKLDDRRTRGSLLLIGPRAHKSGKTGGVSILFELLVRQLLERGVDTRVIDANKDNYRNTVFAICSVAIQIGCSVRGARCVSLHGTANHFIYFAPILVFVCRALRKSISLRKFAGNFDEVFDTLGPLRRKCVVYGLKNADVCFFETRYLVDRFRAYNPATHWMPNCRSRANIEISGRRGPYRKRFVFIGHVRREKGIDELLQASLALDSSYSIFVYGPIEDKKYESLDWTNYRNVQYKGRIDAAEVLTKLCEHDVLLLPTYREGYPGVIIEAFSVGMPVIASRLRGIQEMMTDGVEGILIEPHSVTGLVNAMKSFAVASFEQMSRRAVRRAATFDAGQVTREFLQKLRFEQ